jgi:superfamily II helicase
MDRETIHTIVEKEMDENEAEKFTGQTVIVINSRDGGAGKIQVEKRAKKEYK